MTPQSHPLKFLMPGWFSLVMGLSGLTLAWQRASGLLGPWATGVALVLGAVSALVFGVLLLASLLRWQRHPEALADDLRHPVRHAVVAALPVGALLLVAVAVALGGGGCAVALCPQFPVVAGRFGAVVGHRVGAGPLVRGARAWCCSGQFVASGDAGVADPSGGQCGGACGGLAAGP